MTLRKITLAIAAFAGITGSALAQSNEIKIAHIIGRTGAMEPFATHAGGADYSREALYGRMEDA